MHAQAQAPGSTSWPWNPFTTNAVEKTCDRIPGMYNEYGRFCAPAPWPCTQRASRRAAAPAITIWLLCCAVETWFSDTSSETHHRADCLPCHARLHAGIAPGSGLKRCAAPEAVAPLPRSQLEPGCISASSMSTPPLQRQRCAPCMMPAAVQLPTSCSLPVAIYIRYRRGPQHAVGGWDMAGERSGPIPI